MDLGWTSREKKITSLFAVVFILLASVFAYYHHTSSTDSNPPPTFSTYPQEQEKKEEVIKEDAVENKKEETLWIDLKGAVARPGVYQLPADSRVVDLIDRAGGFTPNAEKRAVNLVERLQDGRMIYIPEQGETEVIWAHPSDANSSQGKGDKISINRANKEQLMSLPGIGEARATAMITYREEHGGFKKTEELMDIPGIGEKIFEQLKENITVE